MLYEYNGTHSIMTSSCAYAGYIQGAVALKKAEAVRLKQEGRIAEAKAALLEARALEALGPSSASSAPSEMGVTRSKTAPVVTRPPVPPSSQWDALEAALRTAVDEHPGNAIYTRLLAEVGKRRTLGVACPMLEAR
jgi:hypothetical protein